MKKNMGLADRSIRLVVAVLLGFFYFSGWLTGGWQVALVIVTSVLALTAVVGICPLYTLLGITTNGGRKDKSMPGTTKTVIREKTGDFKMKP
jgi:hypothetical protein